MSGRVVMVEQVNPVARISRKSRLRYFPRCGHRTWKDRGFQSKRQALEWIERERKWGNVEWQSGFIVKFYGHSPEFEFVDRLGRVPRV